MVEIELVAKESVAKEIHAHTMANFKMKIKERRGGW
jgi:hypothetical protein